MKILFCTSEMSPFAKTGGLADVCGSLPLQLASLGHEVSVIMPKYRQVKSRKHALRKFIEGLPVTVGQTERQAKIFHKRYQGLIDVFFVDNLHYFGRDQLYTTPAGDYPDNDLRFIYFQKAVLEFIRESELKFDIVHCHDWQTGLIPLYMKTLYKDISGIKKAKSVFTIHNLAYQGNFPPDSLTATGLDWSYLHVDKLEFYGKISFIKAGIVYADGVTTVSPQYSAEIQTSEYGCGLEGVLKTKQDRLAGILNGIDLTSWDPETDSELKVNYGINSWQDKLENKKALQSECGLEKNSDAPVMGLVSRLVDQKGLDILEEALKEILPKSKIQFVILGDGDHSYHNSFLALQARFPGKLCVRFGFDLQLAKRIYAGSDVFLMPSRFEPCGLGQMIAMRYGTVPLVRQTGGLADTVTDVELEESGNGFAFKDYDTQTLVDTMNRAARYYSDNPKWMKLSKVCMKMDYSWKKSAKTYLGFYRELRKSIARKKMENKEK